MGPQFHFERSRTSRDRSSSHRESPVLFASEKLSHSFTVIANISLYVTSLSPRLPVMIMKENNLGVLIIHYGQNTK